MSNLRAIAASLALSLVFALALAVAWRSDRSGAAATGLALSSMRPEAVSAIEIVRCGQDGQTQCVSLVRRGGEWLMDRPIRAAADSETAARIVDAVAFAEVRDSLSLADMESFGQSLRDLGLERPRLMAMLSLDGARVETNLFGRTTSTGDEVYVMRRGGGSVFTVPASVLRELDRPAGDLRRKGLFSLVAEDIADIGIKVPGEPFSKLVRSGDAWRLSEPVDAPADRAEAEALVDAVCSARISAYGREGEAGSAAIAPDEGAYTISLRSPLGVVEKVVFGQAAGTNEVWALSSEGAMVKVPASLLERCRSFQRKLEDTRVFPVDESAVTSVVISEGQSRYQVSRRSPADPWRLASPVTAPADAENVARLLGRILSVRGMDVAGESEDALLVSVGTAETNFVERALSGAFLLKGCRLPDLRDRTLMRCPAEKVRRILVATAAGSEWEVRGPSMRGPAADGEDGLLALLASGIVAERVETAMLGRDDFGRYGFDRPSYTLRFELDDSESALRTLLIGSVAADGGRFATVGGSEAAFTLSAATVSALTKPVVDTLKEKK